MTPKEIAERNEKLHKLIVELSQGQDVLKTKQSKNDYYMRVQSIYKTKEGERFRHFYNAIFSNVAEIYSKDKTAVDILGENMRILYEYCMEKNDQMVKDAMSRLFDHVSLDIARIKYVDSIDRREVLKGESLLSQITKADNSIEALKVTYEDIKNNVNNTSKRINHVYSEFISILGIFSAIVLVYFGGTSVIGNIIAGMKETNIFITVIVMSFAGIITFDLLFMFIYFLAKLLDRGIAATNKRVWWESILARAKIRYPIIFYVNIMLIIVIYIASVLGSIQLIIMNQNDVLEWLIDNLLIDFTQRPFLFYAVLGFMCFNVTFVFAYILSKITDFNIGRHIRIRYKNVYTVEKNLDSSIVISNYDYDNAWKAPYKWMAYPYVIICMFFNTIYVTVHNVIQRMVFRYPYWFVVNVVLIVYLFDKW